MFNYPPLRPRNILKTFCFSFSESEIPNFQLELCRRRCWLVFPYFRGNKEENNKTCKNQEMLFENYVEVQNYYKSQPWIALLLLGFALLFLLRQFGGTYIQPLQVAQLSLNAEFKPIQNYCQNCVC